MKNKEELKDRTAAMLYDLRKRRGLSKAAMARKLGIDDHTWNAWESGRTTPSVVDFLSVYDTFGESAMHAFLTMLYPDQYSASSEDMREKLNHFINNVIVINNLSN